ncbi:uncharacterized protein BDR25DRAFT_335621 [Lindgomyces ingoldianus]|uniref:Uncharacterized protein n=1 Tax=Lindgomyces ingoldianus TaxID=673940 RepID=A0ACB6QQ79_9PLEO|nr:uncharacterized protein BDR25DRAFT_335621 [Lindgomyces ingoldianus]KAF2468247.1 hypothetical protein BDR25DRAFT_335621 [Lindgomyces ingoldianus]
MAPANRNPELAVKISQMRLTIAPIVHVLTGQPHPEFPSTMLGLFLLTEDQLDAMARYYSQLAPDAHTFSYPQYMDWSKPFLSKPKPGDTEDESCRLSDYERLKIKMRMFARFIGMRGAETPQWEYERQIELLRANINKTLEEEGRLQSRKWYGGPPAIP